MLPIQIVEEGLLRREGASGREEVRGGRGGREEGEVESRNSVGRPSISGVNSASWEAKAGVESSIKANLFGCQISTSQRAAPASEKRPDCRAKQKNSPPTLAHRVPRDPHTLNTSLSSLTTQSQRRIHLLLQPLIIDIPTQSTHEDGPRVDLLSSESGGGFLFCC